MPAMHAGTTLLCPGQGAQAVGMGKGWAEAHPEAQAIFDRAEAVVGDALGLSFRDLCFSGPADRLNKTDASQPAIYVTSVASWHGICAVSGYAPAEAPLAAAAGLSLGEYTALHLAGAITFEDGLRLVLLRGRAMQDAAEASPSSMVALIGADEASAARLCDLTLERLGDPSAVLVPANFNAPGQVVVSGSLAACNLAESVAGEIGLKATRLTVAGAFHSPLMAPAAAQLRVALASTPIQPPRCPVLSNVTGVPHERDPQTIRARLVEQLTRPVRWAENCAWLVANAVAAGRDPVELAPGRTLAGLMRRISKDTKVVTHDTPA